MWRRRGEGEGKGRGGSFPWRPAGTETTQKNHAHKKLRQPGGLLPEISAEAADIHSGRAV